MDLSQRDLAILSTYQAYGEAPIGKTAQLTGYKPHIVRRTVLKALQDGVLSRRVSTNIFSLGLKQYALLLSFDAKSQEQRKRVEAALLAAPHVQVLIEVDSELECQFYTLVTALDTTALERFFQFITAACDVEVRVTRMQTRCGWYHFGTKCLSPEHLPTPIHIAESPHIIALQDEDLRLLEVYASNQNGVRSHIARTLAMPLMTLQYRIERLEKMGVLKGVRYQISPQALGFKHFRCFIVASLPLESHRNQLFQWAKKHPYIVSMMYGIGNWHYELRIEAPDQAAAEHLVSELVSTFQHFIHFSDLVPMNTMLKLSAHPSYSILLARNEDAVSHTSMAEKQAS